jgi:outer membrane translocation and assembly module TamA
MLTRAAERGDLLDDQLRRLDAAPLVHIQPECEPDGAAPRRAGLVESDRIDGVLTRERPDRELQVALPDGALLDEFEIAAPHRFREAGAPGARIAQHPRDLQAPIRQGETFRGELIEDAIDAMTYVAGTVGYANVDIAPNIERDRENRIVNITFEVNEGPRVFIERIDIVGNTRTLDRVVRREMRVNEGDAFNRVLLDRSRARVRSLGFFRNVTVEESAGSQPDRAKLPTFRTSPSA